MSSGFYGKGQAGGGFASTVALPSEVSKETKARYTEPSTVLLMRDPIDNKMNGVIFVFSINPQSLKYERQALVNVQQGRGGYTVSQNGVTAPRWTLQGHFGWRLKIVAIPSFVAKGLLGKIIAGGNLVHRVPRLENNINDIRFSLGDGQFKNTFGQLTTGQDGTVTFNGKQTMDGQQAWYALHDLILYYFEINAQRVKEGKPPYELVWYDSLHAMKWVVVPTRLPTLERTVSTQGMMPYTLELVGVYDDARAKNKGWKLLNAWGN